MRAEVRRAAEAFWVAVAFVPLSVLAVEEQRRVAVGGAEGVRVQVLRERQDLADDALAISAPMGPSRDDPCLGEVPARAVMTDSVPGWGDSRATLPDTLWDFDDEDAVPASVALSIPAGFAWVAQDLNNHRLQRFAITGDGAPLSDIPGPADSETAGDAAHDADLAVFVAETDTVTLKAYRSVSDLPLWEFTFPEPYTNINADAIRVSRDGGVVCCAVRDDGPPEATRLFIFDGPTGDSIGYWDFPNRVDAIDLTDDGALCLVKEAANGRLIDTATQTEIAMGSVTGVGGFGRISGNGEVFVLGGFNLRVYRRIAGTYTIVKNFTATNEFFMEGAVARDGSTAAAMSVDFTNFRDTSTRVFDVGSGALLGTYDTVGTGTYQDSPSDAAVSDDGSIVAVASWGTQNNDHPEVLVLNRTATLVGSIDTPGSVHTIALSGDGAYLTAGAGAGHANALGNGGKVVMYQVREALDPTVDPLFEKIVDTGSIIPGTSLLFTGILTPSLRDGDIVLRAYHRTGAGTYLEHGIYTTAGGLHAVADLTTPVPGGSGNFVNFGSNPSISGGTIAFTGDATGNVRGVYIASNGVVGLVANPSTPIPGQGGNFQAFSSYVSIDEGIVTFSGTNQQSDTSLHLYENEMLSTVADLTTPIPGGTGNFEGLFAEYFPVDGGKVAFRGFSETEIRFGIYSDWTGVLSTVVDLDTPMPGEGVNFGFVGLAHMRDGKIAFGGSDVIANPTKLAIYVSDQGVLTKIVDLNTPIPDGAGTFVNLFEPCFDGKHVTFQGQDSAGDRNLYTNMTGELRKVIAVGDELSGKIVSNIGIGFECLDGNQIAFRANFTDSSAGVYVVTYPAPPLGDLDGDGDVDLDDHAIFAGCMTGPLRPLENDFDGTGMVDLADFGAWEACLEGPGVAPGIGCAAMDRDDDGDVDLVDFADFQGGFGEALEPLVEPCSFADFDEDANVDLGDFAVFQAGFPTQ